MTNNTDFVRAAILIYSGSNDYISTKKATEFGSIFISFIVFRQQDLFYSVLLLFWCRLLCIKVSQFSPISFWWKRGNAENSTKTPEKYRKCLSFICQKQTCSLINLCQLQQGDLPLLGLHAGLKNRLCEVTKTRLYPVVD